MEVDFAPRQAGCRAGTRKAEALLIYLASTRRSQPREVLADFLWGERLHRQAVYGLSKLIDDEIEHLEYQQGAMHASRLMELDPLEVKRRIILINITKDYRRFANCNSR